MKLINKRGDVTTESTRPLILCHGVNTLGMFGSGIAGAIAKKWPLARSKYMYWANQDRRMTDVSTGYDRPFELGELQLVPVEDGQLVIAQIVSQKGVGTGFFGIPPVRYEAINEGFLRLRLWLDKQETRYTIASGRLGCGLAGGQWPIVERLIKDHFEHTEYTWVVYE